MLVDKNIERVKKAMLAMTRQCWEQGITAMALFETGDMENVDLIIKDMIRRQSDDGRLCNVENTPAVTDSSFCLSAVYLRGRQNSCEEWINSANRNLDFLINVAERGPDGTLYHMKNTTQVWADSAAYLPYSLAIMGHANEAIMQMEGIRKRLFDKETGLYFHMWDDETDSYVRALPWAIGNGWILSGMVRLYEALPDEYSEYKEALCLEVNRLIDTVLHYKTKEYGFRDILNDENSFEESEAAALFSYCIYYAIILGILHESYIYEADRIAKRLETKISSDGEIMDAASSPDFVKPGVSVECQANYILMKLKQNELLQKI